MKLSQSKEYPPQEWGLSLLELLIALTIVAVLSAITLPAYKHYTERQQLRKVQLHLIDLQAFQARYRLRHAQYAHAGDLPAFTDTAYEIETRNVSATGFEIIARARSDASDPSCTLLTVNHRSEKTPAGCW